MRVADFPGAAVHGDDDGVSGDEEDDEDDNPNIMMMITMKSQYSMATLLSSRSILKMSMLIVMLVINILTQNLYRRGTVLGMSCDAYSEVDNEVKIIDGE